MKGIARSLLQVVAIAVIALLLLDSAQARKPNHQPNHFKGWVQLPSGRQVWVDWIKAAPGQETVVVYNGLTYTTRYWNQFAASLIAEGVGVFRFDPEGMGETLLKYAPILEVIPKESQVQDMHDLLKIMGLNKNVNLLGLSYGGGIDTIYAATYPKDIKTLIL